MYADLLLSTLTYPDATPERAIRNGIALARRLGGPLELLVLEVDIPEVRSSIGQALFHFQRVAAREEHRSALAARREVICAEIAAEEAGVPLRPSTIQAAPYLEGDAIATFAKTHDLCLIPIDETVLADRGLAEAVLFGSGRPVLIYPDAPEIAPAETFERVSVAWDGGTRAARAVADAMPVLERASEVRIFVALGEKPPARSGVASDLVRHLRTHGVEAKLEEKPSAGQPIGELLFDHVRSTSADLLVMGAYGRTRLSEFVLGGATEAILSAPPCPALLSH